MGVSAGSLELSVDFRPRAEAGYELRGDDGAYPEPETREMFMQASVRAEFAALYFDESAEAWRAAVLAEAEAACLGASWSGLEVLAPHLSPHPTPHRPHPSL